jgi:hypothetical protein
MFKLRRTFVLLVLAALLSVAAVAQTESGPGPASGPAPAPYKYDAYAGFAYTSLNQVDLSRHGLMGAKVAVTRYWGKYFGLMGTGDYYKWATGSGNPGDPSIYSFMIAPEVHADLWGPLSGFVFGEVGMEHTGGESMFPDTSFAGGFGIGMSWRLSNHWSIRTSGDRVGASFSPNGNTPQLAYSTHRTWNARATIGPVFHF